MPCTIRSRRDVVADPARHAVRLLLENDGPDANRLASDGGVEAFLLQIKGDGGQSSPEDKATRGDVKLLGHCASGELPVLPEEVFSGYRGTRKDHGVRIGPDEAESPGLPGGRFAQSQDGRGRLHGHHWCRQRHHRKPATLSAGRDHSFGVNILLPSSRALTPSSTATPSS